MQFTEKFGRTVRLTEERQAHIEQRKEMIGQIKRVQEALRDPDVVRRSQRDSTVYLYYKHYANSPVSDKYLLVVVKAEIESPFVITAFFTDTIKPGEPLWPKPNDVSTRSN